jgi:acyl carrier protein
MKKIENIIKDILSTILKLPVKKINTSFDYNTTKKWDSLNQIKIIMALESSFQIKIKPEEAIEMMSYKKILQYIRNSI